MAKERLATLLDFNGVLIDDEHLHAACMAEVLAPLGIALPLERYFERYFVLDDAGAFRAVLRDEGRDASDAAVHALVEAKKPVYLRRAPTEARVFPGAAELVHDCAEAGPVAIVSGALRHEIEIALDRLGVRDRVVAIVSAEDTTACKPDPEGYVLGIAALARHVGDAEARRAVVVEDSPGGVRAARAAGLSVAAVLQSVGEPELREAGASLVVPGVADLSADALRAIVPR